MGFWSTSSHQKEQSNKAAVVYGYPTSKQFDPPQHSEPHYLLLPRAPHPPFWRRWSSTIFFLFFLILLAGGAYYLWPDDPHVEVVRLHLNKIDVRSEARGVLMVRIFLDVSMGLTIKVRNKDNFGIYYKSLNVGIGYRGKKIGLMKSEGSQYIPARGTAYVDATLELNGIEVLSDVFYLLEDIARGHIPFQTQTHFNGDVRLLFVKVPLQAVVSCNIDVDTKEQSILRQDCDIGSCC